ncbi:hypothetical protein ACSBR1_033875 [Camellia fascicularis]
MVPGTKTGRRKKTATNPIASPSETFAPVVATPQTSSDATQPPDDTQTCVEETQAHGVGKSNSNRVRGPTVGKGVQKRLARKKREKLHVYVNRMLNALTGGNATPATNELGLQIRRLCPLKGVKSWKKIDKSIKDAVVQAVLDTFEIGEDFHTDQQAQEIVDTKAYLLYKDWRYTLKKHYEKLVEKGVDDQYSNPPKGVCLDDWKHMIDVAWKDESHLKHSKAGKANRSLLPYNHTSGSRSFPIAMSLMADENGEFDFPEFYSKSHKLKKTNEWIDPKCGELHDAMVNVQVTATDAGSPLTHEELSRQVLGQRKNYLRGFGIGPRPYSPSDSAARSRDKQMEAMRSEIDILQANLMNEKEERQRDCEEMTREREELMKEVEEGKKAREAQQEQLNHLNSVTRFHLESIMKLYVRSQQEFEDQVSSYAALWRCF